MVLFFWELCKLRQYAYEQSWYTAMRCVLVHFSHFIHFIHFLLFFHVWKDRPTDRRMDIPYYRDARMHLKTFTLILKIAFACSFCFVFWTIFSKKWLAYWLNIFVKNKDKWVEEYISFQSRSYHFEAIMAVLRTWSCDFFPGKIMFWRKNWCKPCSSEHWCWHDLWSTISMQFWPIWTILELFAYFFCLKISKLVTYNSRRKFHHFEKFWVIFCHF